MKGKKKPVKGQRRTGKTGFEINPQNINREGGPPKELTYRELIKQVGEQQSRYNKLKTRKLVAIEQQWEKAEKGELASFNSLIDRTEGKPPQGIGTYGDDGEFKEQTGFIYLPVKKEEGDGA